jgi:hypothetical protein
MLLKKSILIINLILGISSAYSQTLEVLDFVSNEMLKTNNIRKIEVRSDNEDIISQRLFINTKGLLDSSFLYSPSDTTRVINFQKNYYDNDFRLTHSLLGVETITETDFERDVKDWDKEMVTTTNEYAYNEEGYLLEIKSSGEELSNDLLAYDYSNGLMSKTYGINSSDNDTLFTIDYLYSAEGKLILSQVSRDKEYNYFEYFIYDESGNLTQKHSKNTEPNGRLVFEDDYFQYDLNNNRLVWRRYDGLEKEPVLYEYKYNDDNLLIERSSLYGKERISYH